MHLANVLHAVINGDRHAVLGGGASPPPGQDRETISITRDDRAHDWVIELSPGLDLLEVIQVLNAVQARAIEIVQEQIAKAAIAAESGAAGGEKPAAR